MPKYNDFDLDLQNEASITTERAIKSIPCNETIQYRSCCRPCNDTETFCVDRG